MKKIIILLSFKSMISMAQDNPSLELVLIMKKNFTIKEIQNNKGLCHDYQDYYQKLDINDIEKNKINEIKCNRIDNSSNEIKANNYLTEVDKTINIINDSSKMADDAQVKIIVDNLFNKN